MQELQRLDTEITRLSTTARDCGLLMPDGSPDQQARIAALTATLRRVEADNSDADAKNQLYLLLRERTRCGHSRANITLNVARRVLRSPFYV